MQEEPTPTSIADALMWLNDRLGKSVAAWIEIEEGDSAVTVFDAEGELHHWSEGKAAIRSASREDIAGLYEVDGASINLTGVRPFDVTAWLDEDQLIVRLDARTTLNVIEQEDVPE
jgi:hypothetical protein